MSDVEKNPKPAEPLESVVTERSGTVGEMMGLAFPLMISFLSFSLMGVVDTIVLGYVGTAEQGAAGMGMSVMWAFISLFTGTLSVTSTFVSQANGAGKRDTLYRWVITGLILIVPMSAVVLSFIPALPQFLDWMQTDAAVRPHAVSYMQIRMLATPFILINFALSGFLRGLADMKTPMVVTLIGNVVNGVLDVFLVFGIGPFPELGVQGAALASVIGAGVNASIYFAVYQGAKKHRLYNTRNWTWVSFAEIKKFVKVGLPAGLGWMIESLAWTVMTIYIAAIDPNGLAAHVIIFQLIHLSFMPAAAISIASSTLVGQYLGAERVDLAVRSARQSMIAGMLFMGAIGVIFALFREGIVGLFNPDPDVVKTGGVLLLIAAGFQVFDAMGITISGVLRGAGDTRYPMYCQLGAGWLVFVPLVFVFGQVFEWGVVGAWLAALIFVALLGGLMFLRYIGGKWKTMRVA